MSAPSIMITVSSPMTYIRWFQVRKSISILLSLVGCRII
jgi:hypothetical protein